MYRTLKISVIFLGVLAFMGCKQGQESEASFTLQNTEIEKPIEVLVGNVMTQEQQIALTPDDVINSLVDGNRRFMNDELTARDYSKQVANSAAGQFPDAVIL